MDMRVEDAAAIDAAERSIEWLHEFLEGWFRGAEQYAAAGDDEAGGDEVAFGAFRALFDVEHFAYIYPGGTQEDAAFLQRMRAAFGVNPAFRIRVPRAAMRLRVVATVPAAAGGGEAHFLVTGTYHEFQSGARNSAPENARVSSPLLRVWRPCAGATVGGGAEEEEEQEEASWRVQWLHLHETWLPEGTQPPSATADAE